MVLLIQVIRPLLIETAVVTPEPLLLPNLASFSSLGHTGAFAVTELGIFFKNGSHQSFAVTELHFFFKFGSHQSLNPVNENLH